MLKDATGFKKIYIAAGKTDLRKGMDSLAAIVSLQFELDSYETDILFLFCGSTRRLIKGLVWATIHKDDRFVFGQHDIRFSR